MKRFLFDGTTVLWATIAVVADDPEEAAEKLAQWQLNGGGHPAPTSGISCVELEQWYKGPFLWDSYPPTFEEWEE